MATVRIVAKLSKEEVKDETVVSVRESEVDEGVLPRYMPKYRRKYPSKDVSCTDKDRAAALGMGSENDQDTKEVKKKTDSSEEYIKRKEFIIHSALVEKNLRENKPFLALYSANRALELSAKDRKTLIARAKCYLYLGQNEKALDDIETALAIQDQDTELLYMKAQTLYMMGNFEFAAVYFQRGMQLRPQLKKFAAGLQKAQYSIQNALGGAANKLNCNALLPGNTRIKLTNYQVERLRDKHQQAVRIKKFKDMAAGGRQKKGVTPGPGFAVSPTPSMIKYVTDVHRKTEEDVLLGLVAKEKVFCRDLIQNPSIQNYTILYLTIRARDSHWLMAYALYRNTMHRPLTNGSFVTALLDRV
uniref:Outer dynein arm-docking complex subunit 4 n=1 Tax=Strigamia maritima TaxID=126957 RepID=T1IIA1_STRMM